MKIEWSIFERLQLCCRQLCQAKLPKTGLAKEVHSGMSNCQITYAHHDILTIDASLFNPNLDLLNINVHINFKKKKIHQAKFNQGAYLCWKVKIGPFLKKKTKQKNLDLVSILVYIKSGQNPLIRSQDIKQQYNQGLLWEITKIAYQQPLTTSPKWISEQSFMEFHKRLF